MMNSPAPGYGEHLGVNPWAVQSVPQGSSCSICLPRWVRKDLRCNDKKVYRSQVRLDSRYPTPLYPLPPYRSSGTGFWYYTQHPWPSSLRSQKGLALRLALSTYTCPGRCPLWGGGGDSETCISGPVGTEHRTPPSGPTALVSLVSVLAHRRSLHPLNLLEGHP